MTTPVLTVDLDRVAQAWQSLHTELGIDELHYAVKANPHPDILTVLHHQGCRFEVASQPELAALIAIGVDPADVLFSNPVRPAAHVRQAHEAGCWRFAADSPAELTKLATHAPGCAVYIRVRPPPFDSRSAIPSEGKFGVGHATAGDLLRMARQLKLRPYGLTFHVGSQTSRTTAWADAITALAPLLQRLADDDQLRLTMLDIGGGFPATYTSTPAGDPHRIGALIHDALSSLPYRPPLVVAEPGRGLVAEAGVLTATVIGTATRAGHHWVHLDVGAFHGLIEALETGATLGYPVTDSRGPGPTRRYHLTGPSCDSQDTILHDVELSADISEGDLVYLATTGAYTTAYLGNFNGFPPTRIRCLPATTLRQAAPPGRGLPP